MMVIKMILIEIIKMEEMELRLDRTMPESPLYF